MLAQFDVVCRSELREQVGYLGIVMADLGFVGIKLLTIVVVAVPEGFPLVVTISLTYSMHWMMADKQITVEYFIIGDDILPAVTLLDDTSPGFRDQQTLSLRMNTTAILTDDNLSFGWQIESALFRCWKETLHFSIHRIRQPAAITKCFPF
jgi:hypothetical protein